MKLIFTLILIAILNHSFAQAGKLNRAFGDTGVVLTGYNNSQLKCFASAMQNDNKLVVVGHVDSIGTDGFLVLRYLSGGSLDNSFGTNGKVIINFGYDSHEAHGVAIQPDGKIVVTGLGITGFFDPVYDILTARLKTNGTLDSNFGNNGKVITDFGKAENAYSLCLQSDGKIIVSGNYNHTNFLLLRYKANGNLDSSFGSSGKVINTQISNMAYARSVILQPDGKIIAGGDKSGSTAICVVTRYKTNGVLDSTFGAAGIVYTQCSNYGDQFLKMLLQQDGKIIGVGRTGLVSGSNANENIIAVRYKSNGNLDSTYGVSGIATINFTNASASGRNAVLQTDGKVIIAGDITGNDYPDYVLLRLKTNGSLDSSFGTNGATITDFGLTDVAYSVAIQGNDSSIVVSGSSQSSNTTDTVDVSLAAYNQLGIRQMIVTKIKHWIHHNGILWDNVSGVESYAVERSADGANWMTVNSSQTAFHNQLSSVNYYEDPAPLNGINYYRVQTTNINATTSYSNIIAVTNDDVLNVSIYPNPAKNSLHIHGLLSNQKIKLSVIDFSGNIKLQAVANNYSYILNIASLNADNYLLKIEADNEVLTKKFVKK